MNVVNMGTDPYGVEESQIAQRLRLAQMLTQQGADNQPVYSNKAGIAKALMMAMGGYQTQQAEAAQRELAGRKEAGRKSEIEAIFSQVEGAQPAVKPLTPNDDDGNPMPSVPGQPGQRMTLARLLAGSSNPELAKAGMGMILKGPGKVTYQDAGDHISIRDESGKEVGTMPKGVSPDTRYGKETVGADTRYGKETVGAEARLTDDRTRAEGAANRGVTMRGQNLTDARAHEAAQSGKAPVGYQWDGGRLAAIPGGPADPTTVQGRGQPTEDERRSAGLAIRLENALQTMEQLPSAKKPEKTPAALRSLPIPGIDAAANVITSSDRQQVEASQLDALDAALTLATGAAYTKDQLRNLSKAYFPQIGDSDATVKAKEKNLHNIIETARIRAGRARGDIDRVTGGASEGAWNIRPLGGK